MEMMTQDKGDSNPSSLAPLLSSTLSERHLVALKA